MKFVTTQSALQLIVLSLMYLMLVTIYVTNTALYTDLHILHLHSDSYIQGALNLLDYLHL